MTFLQTIFLLGYAVNLGFAVNNALSVQVKARNPLRAWILRWDAVIGWLCAFGLYVTILAKG